MYVSFSLHRPKFTTLLLVVGCLIRINSGGRITASTTAKPETTINTIFVTDVETTTKPETTIYTLFVSDVDCSQPKDPGYGRFIYSRWYYDAGDMICKPLNYLGSGGNSNQFRSYGECSSQCNSRCYQHIPIKQNSTCDGGGFEWAYDTGRDKCLPFRNSSCHSADYSYNRFQTRRECERECKHYGVDQLESPYICPRINTRGSVCESQFIVSGKVSSIFHEIYTEYLVHRLVVEVTQVHKGHDLLPLYSVNNTDATNTDFVHMKKILVDGRSCHNTDTGKTYVFMGKIEYNKAIIDNVSYVQEERPSTLSKINVYLNSTC